MTAEEALRRLPRCERSDLPRILCGCGKDSCDSFTMTAEESAYLNGQLGKPKTHHVIPLTARRFDYPTRNRPRDSDNNVLEDALVGDWAVGLPSVIVCDHGHSDDVFMCSLCTGEFERTLGDVPALVLDLELAVTKQVSFLQRGAPLEADPDESVLPYHQAASKALDGLRRAFGAEPVLESRRMLRTFPDVCRQPDLAMVAGRITAAVAHAHRVIDRPPTPMHYGPCPMCGEDITQERVPEGGEVRHDCGYHATLEDHQRKCLDAGADRWLTLTELVSTLTTGGVPITRQRIETMIHNQGLPRESANRPRWTDGRLVPHEVSVYRLGDVMDILDEADATLTTSQVATRLGVTDSAVRKLVERKQIHPVRPQAKPLRFTEDAFEAYVSARSLSA